MEFMQTELIQTKLFTELIAEFIMELIIELFAELTILLIVVHYWHSLKS